MRMAKNFAVFASRSLLPHMTSDSSQKVVDAIFADAARHSHGMGAFDDQRECRAAGSD